MLQRIILISLVAFAAVSTDLYLPAIPQIIDQLGATNSQGQLTLSVFLLGFATGQLFYGNLSDQFGRKPLVFVGLGIYILASVACVFAYDIESLIIARAVQGVGAAAGPVLARAMLIDSYERIEAAKVMAAMAGAMAMVPAVAPLFGSWLLYLFNWQALFLVLALFGILSVIGVASLQETCKSIGHKRFKMSSIISQFPRCLGNRNFVGYTLCGSAIYAAMFCYISTTAFIIIDLLRVKPENFGYTFLVVVLGYISGARLGSSLVYSWGISKVIGFGQLIGVAAAVLLLILAAFSCLSLSAILFCFFLVFLAGGTCLALSQMGAISELSQSAGSASSVFGFTQFMLAAGFGYVVGVFYDDSLLPTAIGVAIAVCLSTLGYYLIDKHEEVET